MSGNGSQLKFGVMGRSFPPMEHALNNPVIAEREGWDFVTYADQMLPGHPPGMMGINGRSTTPDVENAVASLFGDEWFESVLMSGVAACKTEKLGILHGVVDAVRRSPAVWAQELVTMSHLSRGRNSVAFGSGELKQFEPYGERRDKPIGRMAESIRTMRALWSAPMSTVSRESEFFPLKNAFFPLPLYEGKEPKILIVGGGPTIESLVAEVADGWFTYIPGGAEDDIEGYAQMIERIRSGTAERDRDPDALEIHAEVLAVVADTDDRAWELARSPVNGWGAMLAGVGISGGKAFKKWGIEHPLGEKFSWSTNPYGGLPWTIEEATAMVAKLPDEVFSAAYVWGSPETIAKRLEPWVAAGVTHIHFINFAGIADPSENANFSRLISRVKVGLGGTPLRV